MILSLLFALFPPVLAGFVLVSWFRPTPAGGFAAFLLRSCVGLGCGLGLSSCLFFGWLVLIGAPGTAQVVTDCVLCLGCSVYFLIRLWRVRDEAAPSAPAGRNSLAALRVILYCLLIASVAAHLGIFLVESSSSPHGSWDAWAIWNNRARFLFLGGDHWIDAFRSGAYTHADYPLLLPSSVARAWSYAGTVSSFVPIALAALFTFASVGLLVAGLTVMRGGFLGSLAGLMLLGAPTFMDAGASQYADVPLSFFILSTVVAFSLRDGFFPDSRRLVVLAGVMAGLAAWTKNEGQLFAAMVPLARAVIIRKCGWRFFRQDVAAYVLGLFPAVVVLLYFKVFLAPVNDLVAGQSLQTSFERLGDTSRWREIAAAFGIEMLGFGPLKILCLVVYFLLAGRSVDRPPRQSAAFVPVLLALMLTGYFTAYLTTPHDLHWHLINSANRLIVQLWPAALFGYFLIVATPDKLMRKRIGEPAPRSVPKPKPRINRRKSARRR